MATVYEAHDELLDRAVAVKLLRSEALSEHTARQRFAGEARAAASLTHPHAVAVYDVNSGDEQPFIVMELVRGRTLQDVLEDRGHLDDDEAVAVASQVLAALHTAHRRGLVHRDVKPANILLPDGMVPTRPEELPGVKLADFGIAKATADATVGLTMVGQVIGTPKYLSPEQVKGERATAQSDLYATAVVLYEMLGGRPPFDQDSALGLALAHREDEPPPLADLRPDLNPSIVDVVHRALAKDPADRPSDANDMREALIAAASGTRTAPMAAGAGSGTQVLDSGQASTQVVTPHGRAGAPTGPAGPATTTPGPVPPPSRGRRWWLIGLVILILAGVLAALWLAGRPAGDPSGADTTPGPATEEAPAGEQQEDAPADVPADPEPEEEPQDDEGPAAPEPEDEAPADEPTAPPADEDPTG